MQITEKARDVLARLLTAFEHGTIPEAIAHMVIPTLDIPASKWSLNNRILTFLAGTQDARGHHQWYEVGRWVMEGRKAFYILAPLIVKKKKASDDEEVEDIRLVGFRAVPVFRVEDTDGKPIAYPAIRPAEPPPLAHVAEQWGITIDYRTFTGDAYGAYRPGQKAIVLCTHDEDTFFHELAHAAHEQVLGQLQLRQEWRQEVVAELTAATLMHLYGRAPQDGRAYRYIARYAEQAGYDPYRACLQVISETEQCLKRILTVSAPNRVTMIESP